MKAHDVMTRDVKVTHPDQPIQEAARLMAENDVGALPVGEGDQLIGMITDRDLAVRALAAGKGPQTLVREAMTAAIKYCFEDEDTDEVARNMGYIQIRRLPVVNHEKQLVGIISLRDLADTPESLGSAGEALSGISHHS